MRPACPAGGGGLSEYVIQLEDGPLDLMGWRSMTRGREPGRQSRHDPIRPLADHESRDRSSAVCLGHHQILPLGG